MWKVSLHLTKDLECKKGLFSIQRIKTLRCFTEMISVSYHLGFHILKKLSVFFVGEILHPGDPKKKKRSLCDSYNGLSFFGAGQGRIGPKSPN